MGYEEAIGYLYGLQKHGIKLGLENPSKLLSLMGNPHEAFKSIHVAGTNGKGSTSLMAASLLENSGLRTGLFTSPHLVSFTERIKINGSEIAEDEVAALAEEIGEGIKGLPLPVTFFEFATAMAFLYFKRRGVQWAVVETGMGGRLDATNVIRPEVSIITSIAEDHKEFLGESLVQIASEKAGIIKEGVPVVSAHQEPEVMDVFKSRASACGSTFHAAGEDFIYEVKRQEDSGIRFDYCPGDGPAIRDIAIPLSGAYQAENASLAIRAYSLLFGAGGVEDALRMGVRPWPGRLERIAEDILIDGAHNPASAKALAGALKTFFVRLKGSSALIMGLMRDKDAGGVMGPLLPLFDEIIFTAPRYERAASPEELKERASALGYESRTAPTVAEAIGTARRKGPAMIVITGSFFVIGEAKEALGQGRGSLRGLGEWPEKR